MVGGDKETNDYDTTNVEEQDTDVDALDGFGQVAAWVLRLTSSDLLSALAIEQGWLGMVNTVQQQSRYR